VSMGYGLRCNYENCKAHSDVELDENEARRKAGRTGWLVCIPPLPLGDFCPDHGPRVLAQRIADWARRPLDLTGGEHDG
jgi:hypothetical protein